MPGDRRRAAGLAARAGAGVRCGRPRGGRPPPAPRPPVRAHRRPADRPAVAGGDASRRRPARRSLVAALRVARRVGRRSPSPSRVVAAVAARRRRRRCRRSPRRRCSRARGVADLRLAALEGGPLPHMHGRSVSARAVLLEPVRERAVGPAVARARLLGGPADGEVAVLRVRERAAELAGRGRDRRGGRRRSRRSGGSTPTSAGAARAPPLDVTGARAGPASGAAALAGLVDAARRRAEAGLVARPARARRRRCCAGWCSARTSGWPTTCATTSSAPASPTCSRSAART